MKIFEKDLTKLSTVRTKSYAKYFCYVTNVEDLSKAFKFLKDNDLGYVVLGNGSNILFSKEKYEDILFIKLSGEFNFFKIKTNSISIGAAYSLKLAGKELIKNGFKNYIFFNLIPACVGGAIVQNAGTGKGEEIKDVCKSIKLYDLKQQKVVEFNNINCQFAYRSSIIKKIPNRYIVLSADFSVDMRTDNIDALTLKMKDRIVEKIGREPSGYSFGSTFMNDRLPAWKCVKHIRDSLNSPKGAFYSDKHSNWIINRDSIGGDIATLIQQTQKIVKSELNIELQKEVRII